MDRQDYVFAICVTTILATLAAIGSGGFEPYGMVIVVLVIMAATDFSIYVASKF